MIQKFPCHLKPSFSLSNESSAIKSPENPPKGKFSLLFRFDVAIFIRKLRNFFHEAFLVILSFFLSRLPCWRYLIPQARKKIHVVQLLSSTSNFLFLQSQNFRFTHISKFFLFFHCFIRLFYTLIVLGNHEKNKLKRRKKIAFGVAWQMARTKLL